MKYKAYTINLGFSAQNIITDLRVSHQVPADAAMMPARAIKCRGKWDTGCNMTCITQDLFHKLNLPVRRSIEVKTPHGTSTVTHTAKISIEIPNGQIMPDVEVCIADMVDADVLIGMDVITQGDFALSHNKHGELIFSICMPPLMSIDLKPVAEEVNDGRLSI